LLKLIPAKMPGKSSKSQRNLTEQADELRRKKLLLGRPITQ